MDFAGPASTLEIKRTDDTLLFMVTPLKRWIDVFIVVGVVVFFCLTGLLKGHPIGFLFVLGISGYLAFNWFNPTTASLFVSQYELISSKSGTVRWRDIHGITYSNGGEDDPSGLFAKGGLNNDCLLVIDEGQTQEVITAIHTHFRNLELKPPSPRPTWMSK